MPWAPPKRCSKPGCGKLVKAGISFCTEHMRERWRNEDRTRKRERFYDRKEWTELRDYYRRAHPLCELCAKQGMRRPTKIVDHVVPIKQGGAPLDVRNLQSLCHTCHQQKRGKERHGL